MSRESRLPEASTAAPAAPPNAAASLVTTCPVCAFQAESARRDLFWTFAERVGDPDFNASMERGGGYCERHVRHLLRLTEGSALSAAYQAVLRGRLGRLERSAQPAAHGGRRRARPAKAPSSYRNRTGCPSCDVELWAANHALHFLAGGDADRLTGMGIDPDGPLCLPHTRSLLLVATWYRVPAYRERILERLEQVGTVPSILDRLIAVAGLDRDAVVRPSGEAPFTRPPAVPAPRSSSSWQAGSISAAGLAAELTGGRCPACSAGRAAAETFLGWTGVAGRSPNDLRDFGRLCADHLWDAAWVAPLAAERALATTIDGWLAVASRLPGNGAVPSTRLAGRVAWAARSWRPHLPLVGHRREGPSLANVVRECLGPGDAVAESVRNAVRPSECAACRAMATAVRRTLQLVAATLLSATGRELYLRSDGLCLRHLEAASFAGEAGRAAVERARARVALVDWELEETRRKTAWSSRFEPGGPEGGAWRRAAVLAVGSACDERELLAPEPRGPGDAI